MINYWFISDTHFNHENILKFKNFDGSLQRNFDSISEMNELIIKNWNEVVKPEDKVYHLGDVIMGNHVEYDLILSRLNGKKRLILGNHDEGKLRFLSKHFQKVSGARHLNIGDFKCVLSHVPLHPHCITRFGNLNIHGHLHKSLVQSSEYNPIFETIGEDDKHYINVCVEQINYRPIELEELKKYCEK